MNCVTSLIIFTYMKLYCIDILVVMLGLAMIPAVPMFCGIHLYRYWDLFEVREKVTSVTYNT